MSGEQGTDMLSAFKLRRREKYLAMYDNLQRKRALLKWSHKKLKIGICETRLWDKICTSKYNHLQKVYVYLICLCSFSHWCSRVFQVRHRNNNRREFLSGLLCYLLSAGCSGTVTSILPDISVDITIFLNKDISASNGFGLIFLSRSNNVRLIFAAVAYRFQDSCWTGELQVLPLLSSQLASHVGLFLD